MDDLLARIEDLLREDPAAAGRLADVALVSAGDEVSTVIRVLCSWGAAQRAQAKWDAAEAAYGLAKSLLELTGGTPEGWLSWHRRMTYLRRDQRRLDEALEHVETALELGRTLRDPVLLARVLVDEALVARLIDQQVARKIAEQALEALPEEDVRHRRAALHVILGTLCYDANPDVGEIRRRVADLHAFGDPPKSHPGTVLLWYEGLADLRDGRPQRAVKSLLTAHDQMKALNVPAFAAACALDLAEAHLASDDLDAAASVAGLLFPIFKALRNRPSALAALRIFCRAAESRTLDVSVVRDVRERLEASVSGPQGRPADRG